MAGISSANILSVNCPASLMSLSQTELNHDPFDHVTDILFSHFVSQ